MKKVTSLLLTVCMLLSVWPPILAEAMWTDPQNSSTYESGMVENSSLVGDNTTSPETISPEEGDSSEQNPSQGDTPSSEQVPSQGDVSSPESDPSQEGASPTEQNPSQGDTGSTGNDLPKNPSPEQDNPCPCSGGACQCEEGCACGCKIAAPPAKQPVMLAADVTGPSKHVRITSIHSKQVTAANFNMENLDGSTELTPDTEKALTLKTTLTDFYVATGERTNTGTSGYYPLAGTAVSSVEAGLSLYYHLGFGTGYGPNNSSTIADMNENYTVSVSGGDNWIESVEFERGSRDGETARAFIKVNTKEGVSGTQTATIVLESVFDQRFGYSQSDELFWKTRAVYLPIQAVLSGPAPIKVLSVGGQTIGENTFLDQLKVAVWNQDNLVVGTESDAPAAVSAGDSIYLRLELDGGPEADLTKLSTRYSVSALSHSDVAFKGFACLDYETAGNKQNFMVFEVLGSATPDSTVEFSFTLSCNSANQGLLGDHPGNVELALGPVSLQIKPMLLQITHVGYQSINNDTMKNNFRMAVAKRQGGSMVVQEDALTTLDIEQGEYVYVRLTLAGDNTADYSEELAERFLVEITSAEGFSGLEFVGFAWMDFAATSAKHNFIRLKVKDDAEAGTHQFTLNITALADKGGKLGNHSGDVTVQFGNPSSSQKMINVLERTTPKETLTIRSLGNVTIGTSERVENVRVARYDPVNGYIQTEAAVGSAFNLKAGEKIYVRLVVDEYASTPFLSNPNMLDDRFQVNVHPSSTPFVKFNRFVYSLYKPAGTAENRNLMEFEVLQDARIPEDFNLDFDIVCKPGTGAALGTAGQTSVTVITNRKTIIITSLGYRTIDNASQVENVRLAKYDAGLGHVLNEKDGILTDVHPGDELYVRAMIDGSTTGVEPETLASSFDVGIIQGNEYLEFDRFDRRLYKVYSDPNNTTIAQRSFLVFKVKPDVEVPAAVNLRFQITSKTGGQLGTISANRTVTVLATFSITATPPTDAKKDRVMSLRAVGLSPVIPKETVYPTTYGVYTSSTQSAGVNRSVDEVPFEPGYSLYFAMDFEGGEYYTPTDIDAIEKNYVIQNYQVKGNRKLVTGVEFVRARRTSSGPWAVFLVVRTANIGNVEPEQFQLTVTLASRNGHRIGGKENTWTKIYVEMTGEYARSELVESYNSYEIGDTRHVTFADEAKDVTLVLDEDITIFGDMSGQKEMIIYYTDSSSTLLAKYPHAKLVLFQDAGARSTFRRAVTMTIPYTPQEDFPGGPFIYVDKGDDGLVEIKNAYDRELQAFVFQVRKLERYVISDCSLDPMEYLIPINPAVDPNRIVNVIRVGYADVRNMKGDTVKDELLFAPFHAESGFVLRENASSTFTPGETLRLRLSFEDGHSARNLEEMVNYSLELLSGKEYIKRIGFDQLPYNDGATLQHRIFIYMETKENIPEGAKLSTKIKLTSSQSHQIGNQADRSVVIPLELTADPNSLERALIEGAKGQYIHVTSIGYQGLSSLTNDVLSNPPKAGRYDKNRKMVVLETPIESVTPGETLYFRLSQRSGFSSYDLEKFNAGFRLDLANGSEYVESLRFALMPYDTMKEKDELEEQELDERVFIALTLKKDTPLNMTVPVTVLVSCTGYNRLGGQENRTVQIPLALLTRADGLEKALLEASKGKYYRMSALAGQAFSSLEGNVITAPKAGRFDEVSGNVMYETPLNEVTPGETLYFRLAFSTGYSATAPEDMKRTRVELLSGKEFVENVEFVYTSYDDTRELRNRMFLAVTLRENIPMYTSFPLRLAITCSGYDLIGGIPDRTVEISKTVYTTPNALQKALKEAAKGPLMNVSTIGGQYTHKIRDNTLPNVKLAFYDAKKGYVGPHWSQLAYTPGENIYLRLMFKSGSGPADVEDLASKMVVTHDDTNGVITGLSFAKLPYYNGEKISDTYFIVMKTSPQLPTTKKISFNLKISMVGHSTLDGESWTNVPISIQARSFLTTLNGAVPITSSYSDSDAADEAGAAPETTAPGSAETPTDDDAALPGEGKEEEEETE